MKKKNTTNFLTFVPFFPQMNADPDSQSWLKRNSGKNPFFGSNHPILTHINTIYTYRSGWLDFSDFSYILRLSSYFYCGCLYHDLLHEHFYTRVVETNKGLFIYLLLFIGLFSFLNLTLKCDQEIERLLYPHRYKEKEEEPAPPITTEIKLQDTAKARPYTSSFPQLERLPDKVGPFSCLSQHVRNAAQQTRLLFRPRSGHDISYGGTGTYRYRTILF